MADANRGAEWAGLLTRTQAGLALLVLVTTGLFVSTIPALDGSTVTGPAVSILVVAAGVLAVLDYLQLGTRIWGLVGGPPSVDGRSLAVALVRGIELGIAVLVGLLFAGIGWVVSLPGGSPQAGGYILAGVAGLAVLGVALAGTVLLRVVIASLAGSPQR